jgi:hypothetical protein
MSLIEAELAELAEFAVLALQFLLTALTTPNALAGRVS